MWTYDMLYFTLPRSMTIIDNLIPAPSARSMTIIDKNHNILQWCKQNNHFHRITGNKYSTLYVKKK